MALKLGGRTMEPTIPKGCVPLVTDSAIQALYECHTAAQRYLGWRQFRDEHRRRLDRRQHALDNPQNQHSPQYAEKYEEYKYWQYGDDFIGGELRRERWRFLDSARMLDTAYAKLPPAAQAELTEGVAFWEASIPLLIDTEPTVRAIRTLKVWRALLPNWGTGVLEEAALCPF